MDVGLESPKQRKRFLICFRAEGRSKDFGGQRSFSYWFSRSWEGNRIEILLGS
jgi:hypothetical protein